MVRKIAILVIILLLVNIGAYAQREVLKFQRMHKVYFEKIQVPRDIRDKILEDIYKGLTIEILAVFFSIDTEMWLFWTSGKSCIDIRSAELIETIKKKDKKPEDIEIVIHNHPVSRNRVLPGLSIGDFIFYNNLRKAGMTNAKFLVWCEGITFNDLAHHEISIEEFKKLYVKDKKGGK